jgi:hypothetical protein
MKATLEFELPEETDSHNDAMNGAHWRMAMDGLNEWMRGQLKYGHSFKSAGEALEAARAELFSRVDEFGLKLL